MSVKAYIKREKGQNEATSDSNRRLGVDYFGSICYSIDIGHYAALVPIV